MRSLKEFKASFKPGDFWQVQTENRTVAVLGVGDVTTKGVALICPITGDAVNFPWPKPASLMFLCDICENNALKLRNVRVNLDTGYIVMQKLN